LFKEWLASSELQRLLGINKSVLAELVGKGVVTRGKRRGTYKLESVTAYCAHLREIASGRGGDAARWRLEQVQGKARSS
jgi:hypothetical protein